MRSSLLIACALIPFLGCGSSFGPPVGLPGSSGTQKLPDGGVVETGAQRPRFEDYIRGDRFSKLVLEVDAVPGFEMRESTGTAVAAQMASLLDKPGGISASQSSSLLSRGADHAWTFSELDALAKETFDLEVASDTTRMHVLFVDGHYAEDTSSGKILGIAWAHTHLVMFKKTIEETCRTGITGVLADRLCENAEHGVLVHEIGHLLGLVDNGLPMVHDHKDPDHGAHDSSQDCVMYWAYDTGTIVDDLRSRILGGNEAKLEFDQACKDDVAAVRSR